MSTPLGMHVRDLIDQWQWYWYESSTPDQKISHIRMLIDGHDFIMFFKYKDDVYAASEIARLTFASLKDSEDETGESFTATNLTNALKGSPTQGVFGKEELDEIEVLGREDAISELTGDKHDHKKRHEAEEKVDDLRKHSNEKEKETHKSTAIPLRNEE